MPKTNDLTELQKILIDFYEHIRGDYNLPNLAEAYALNYSVKLPELYLERKTHIDNRRIKCNCGNPSCKIGLNHDTNENGELYLFLTNKYGNDSLMKMEKKEIKELRKLLKQYL